MNRILVTGATGSIGSRVVRLLVGQGREVIVLARQGSSLSRLNDVLPQIRLLRADFVAEHDLARILKEARPEALLHLGWQGVGGAERNSLVQVENLHASIRLYVAAREAGCGTMVGVGSQAEYGWANGSLSETAPTYPTTLYGAAKLATGIVLERMASLGGARFAWLRLFSSYGPGDDPQWLIQYVARQLLVGKRPALTTAKQLWDYIHVDDAATAIVAAMDRRLHGFYNLGSGVARRLDEILLLLRDMIDPELQLGFGELPHAKDQIWHLEADIGKLKEATGWRPMIDLEAGLGTVLDWLRQNS